MTLVNSSTDNTTGTTLGDLVGEDAELVASAMVNLQMLGYMAIAYTALHFLFTDQFYNNPLKRGRGPEPLPRARAWRFVPIVLRMSDDDIERYSGLDALAFLEFIWLALKILSYYAVYGLVVSAVSSWVAATWGEGEWEGPEGGLARLSIANMRAFRDAEDIFSDSWDRWLPSIVSVVGCMLLTGVTIRLLAASWEKIIARRSALLANASDYSALTVLVRTSGLHAKRPTAAAEARALWELLYPGQVYDVRMVRDSGDLAKLLAKRGKLSATIAGLERKATAEAEKEQKKPRGPADLSRAVATAAEQQEQEQAEAEKAGGACFGLRASAAAKLRRARAARDVVDGELRDELDVKMGDANDVGFNYFVLFASHRACNLAKQVVNTPDANLRVVAAPLMEDVRWASLVPAAQRRQTAVAGGGAAAYWLGLAFYAFPIGMVSTFLEIDNLRDSVPGMDGFLEAIGGEAQAFLTAFLPTLALLLFLALLPLLCHVVAGTQGFGSLGEQSRDGFGRLFLFQFVWVFLGVTLGSTALALTDSIEEYASEPATILTTLGGELANSSVFFMSYLLMLEGFGLPFRELTRIVPIAVWWLKSTATRAVGAVADLAPGRKAAEGGGEEGGGEEEEGGRGGATAPEESGVVVAPQSHPPPRPPAVASTDRLDLKRGYSVAAPDGAVARAELPPGAATLVAPAGSAWRRVLEQVHGAVPQGGKGDGGAETADAWKKALGILEHAGGALESCGGVLEHAGVLLAEAGNETVHADVGNAARRGKGEDGGDGGGGGGGKGGGDGTGRGGGTGDDGTGADSEARPAPFPDEPFPFMVNWAKVMLACTFGICYAPVQPVALLFSGSYLLLSYLLYARGLLWSYTHASESRGAFWPSASSRLLLILFFAQLMLTGIHFLKKNWLTAAAVALHMPVTRLADRHFRSHCEPRLAILPLLKSASKDVADDVVDDGAGVSSSGSSSSSSRTGGRAPSLAAPGGAPGGGLMRKQSSQVMRLEALFDSRYVQPELLEAALLVKERFGESEPLESVRKLSSVGRAVDVARLASTLTEGTAAEASLCKPQITQRRKSTLAGF